MKVVPHERLALVEEGMVVILVAGTRQTVENRST
jgi:hypothetical protein